MSRIFNYFVKQSGTIAVLFILCALIFMLSGCGKSNSSFEGADDSKECDDVFCTEEYRHIGMTLTYPDGKPVLLDDTKVFWVSKNRYLEPKLISLEEAREFGFYVIVKDAMVKELQNKKEVMRFTGYLNGKKVCEREVLIGADCCHVRYYGTEPLTQIIQY